MNTHTDHLPESRLAAGIKTAALVAIIGIVAAVAQPSRMSDDVFHALPTATTASAPAGDADTGYFPARYPAPTTVVEQAPTF